MDSPLQILIACGAGSALGAGALWFFQRVQLGNVQLLSQQIVERAEIEAEKRMKELDLQKKESEALHQVKLKEQWDEQQKKLQLERERLQDREDKLEGRFHLMERKLSDTERREAVVNARKKQNDEERQELRRREEALDMKIEQLSCMTQGEARSELLTKTKTEIQQEVAAYLKTSYEEAKMSSQKEASKIIAQAISRLASPTVSEAATATVNLPSPDMKGKIIGREGRNIRSLEAATGVNFVLDDTPGTILISGFDPVRRHIAKEALQELILDGRIHPTRIEEIVAKITEQTKQNILQYGQDAAIRVGVVDLHPELLDLLGKLKFRTSYGQNILDHSLEVSFLLGMMAAELKLDQSLARRIGLLHDIGKAVTHEMEGTHALIGQRLAKKYGESDEVANGIGCHHGEIDPITIEGSLCGAADAISASRPGARLESMDAYVRRVEKLEEIAKGFPGVTEAYALQAGRELRVSVLPDMIDDKGTMILARDIAQKIEKQLSYPGKIKITLIRERRAVEYAL